MGGGFFGGQSSQQQQQTSSTTSPYAAPLAGQSQALSGVGIPLASLAGSQMMEALRTGGVNAFLPFITRALDAVRQAGTSSINDLRQLFARGGFGRTGMAAADIAQAKQSVNQQVASTPSQMLSNWITQAGPFGLQLAGAGLQGLSSAGGLTRTGTGTSSGTSTYTPGLLDWMSLGIGSPGLAQGTGSAANAASAPLGTFWNWFSGSGGGAPGAAASAGSDFASSGYDPFLWSGSAA